MLARAILPLMFFYSPQTTLVLQQLSFALLSFLLFFMCKLQDSNLTRTEQMCGISRKGMEALTF